MNKKKIVALVCVCIAVLCSGCGSLFGSMPVKQYYVLNYIPSADTGSSARRAYPYTIRVRELDIEEAYARTQLVYRQSPFELRYYNYKLWAVKPNKMVTELVRNHIVSSNLVKHVVLRYDENYKPDYELSGDIKAMEEYDSDQLWFAHLALRLSLVRLSDGTTIYSRQFDNRKRVFKYLPEAVVQEMSIILEFIMNQAINDMDAALAQEEKISQKTSNKSDTINAGTEKPKEH
jgi:ABC-type uncharacterized transport system auxiliary subunit